LKNLLHFVKETTGKAPSTLHVHDLDAPMILQFLDYLEHHRGNAIRSRNMRLAAIRSFAHFLALRDPASLAITTRLLAIPGKRADKKLIGALTWPEVEALLAAPDRSSWGGRRDYSLPRSFESTAGLNSAAKAVKSGQNTWSNGQSALLGRRSASTLPNFWAS
jgi:integrase